MRTQLGVHTATTHAIQEAACTVTYANAAHAARSGIKNTR